MMGHLRTQQVTIRSARSAFRLWLVLCLLQAGGWAQAAQPTGPTTVAALRAMDKGQARLARPVQFEGTVTWFSSLYHYMFVQDGDAGIFVYVPSGAVAEPGDRVLVRGRTHAEFSPDVVGYDLVVLRHGALPEPIPTSFEQLITGNLDCRLVTVRGHVQSADLVIRPDLRSRATLTTHLSYLELKAQGGNIALLINTPDADRLKQLLDADIEVTGVAGGQYDSKWHQTGVLLRATGFETVRVLQTARTDPWSIPLTPMGKVLSTYRVNDESRRVRVQGTVTYFQPGYYRPGSALVLQNGAESLWVESLTDQPIHVGDSVSVTGFPNVENGTAVLIHSEVQTSGKPNPATPFVLTSDQLIDPDLAGKHHYDLVSMEGTVVTQVREASQDSFVLTHEGLLFSAILHRPETVNEWQLAPMPQIAPGSRVRVTGICVLQDGAAFSGKTPFDILMRSFDDIAVVSNPPLLNNRNLIRAVTLLVLIVAAVAGWNWSLRGKVRRQTRALASRAAEEARQERHIAQMEQRRSRILEDINGSRPLAEILEEITALVSFQLQDVPCWCEISEGARLGHTKPDTALMRFVREEIPARNGPPLGFLYAALDLDSVPGPAEKQAFLNGARLATLAIETRRLYTELVRRSEFDLLTDIHNRFSLDNEFDKLIAQARDQAGIFGLVYLDLDEFKQVNDVYGHHVGDLYLQEVAKRMKSQLRAGDLLARLGGDEFAVLVPSARTRQGVQEIAARLEYCFEEPFQVEGYAIRGSASLGIALYPEDGDNRDTLLSAADAAMYVAKHTRHNSAVDGLPSMRARRS